MENIDIIVSWKMDINEMNNVNLTIQTKMFALYNTWFALRPETK